jgi:WD40 repeat protein
VLLALALPSQAAAAIVFVRTTPAHVEWIFRANDDGSGVHRLIRGSWPRLSPDGSKIALLRFGRYGDASLHVLDGERVRRLSEDCVAAVAWAPDSRRLACMTGEPARLEVIDTETGRVTEIAAVFTPAWLAEPAVSFSPDGRQLVWASAPAEGTGPSGRLDLFVADVDGRNRRRLVRNGELPLWGPDAIAFHRRSPGTGTPEGFGQIWLVRPDGRGLRRLTSSQPLVPATALLGLVPAGWSAAGDRLLAAHRGENIGEAFSVDVASGRAWDLTPHELEVSPVALSPGGGYALALTGGFDLAHEGDLLRVRFEGGRGRVLLRDVMQPHWAPASSCCRGAG